MKLSSVYFLKALQFRLCSYLAFFIMVLFHSTNLVAQANDSLPPPYKRFPILPPFELKGVNDNLIKRDDMAKRKATIVMFFSPDCHHCIDQFNQLNNVKKDFEKYNLVMATYQPMEQLQEFYKQYGLETWKNLYIGRDEKYFLPTYYRLSNLPFIALYDRKGKLIETFENTTPAARILSTLEQ